jgi:CheY-like chemotaxis protein
MSEYSGSGLGLYISRMLSELMGGRIWVDPAEGGGSEFKFTLQCTLASEEQGKIYRSNLKRTSVPLETPRSDRPSLKVLIVEDNEINRSVIVRLLSNLNCICATARDGVEGFEEFTRNVYDLIFMDVSMPRMNGYECTKLIREYEAKHGLKHVNIVGLSGNARQEHQDQGIMAGMDLYITKPIQKKDLIQVVEQTNKLLNANRQQRKRD